MAASVEVPDRPRFPKGERRSRRRATRARRFRRWPPCVAWLQSHGQAS